MDNENKINESQEANEDSLHSIIKEAFDRIHENEDLTKYERTNMLLYYKKTATNKLKQICKVLDINLDEFAIKSRDRIVEYTIPKEFRDIFLSFLLIDGRKGSTLSKLITDKDTEITSEEKMIFLNSMIEIEINNEEEFQDFNEKILQYLTSEILKFENMKTEILAKINNNAEIHLDYVSPPLSLKDINTYRLFKYDTSDNINSYINQVKTFAENFFIDEMYELFELYYRMIDKASAKWLELIKDYGKLKYNNIKTNSEDELTKADEDDFAEYEDAENILESRQNWIKSRRNRKNIFYESLIPLILGDKYREYFDSSTIEKFKSLAKFKNNE